MKSVPLFHADGNWENYALISQRSCQETEWPVSWQLSSRCNATSIMADLLGRPSWLTAVFGPSSALDCFGRALPGLCVRARATHRPVLEVESFRNAKRQPENEEALQSRVQSPENILHLSLNALSDRCCNHGLPHDLAFHDVSHSPPGNRRAARAREARAG